MNIRVRILKTIFAITAASCLLVSCEAINNWIHDDVLVAKIGKDKLFLSDLEAYIPNGVTPEDSTNLAMQFINSWASEILYADIAEEQLSKEEMDVSKELEDYRRSLLKYRYEQRYINERLDTLVSETQVREYYESHRKLFVLDVPIVKARFLDIMQESPNIEILKDKMSSNSYQDLVEADSLAYSSALKYDDSSDKWVDLVSFARYFGTDYSQVLSRWNRNSGFIEMADERGDLKIGYICDFYPAGTVAPIEFCEERIKDIILSSRKQELLSKLDEGLLQDALDKHNLVIY